MHAVTSQLSRAWPAAWRSRELCWGSSVGRRRKFSSLLTLPFPWPAYALPEPASNRSVGNQRNMLIPATAPPPSPYLHVSGSTKHNRQLSCMTYPCPNPPSTGLIWCEALRGFPAGSGAGHCPHYDCQPWSMVSIIAPDRASLTRGTAHAITAACQRCC